MRSLVPMVCGFALDTALGDPYSMPHVIRLVGKLIASSEQTIRRLLPSTPAGERAGGILLAVTVDVLSCAGMVAVLRLANAVSPKVGFAAHTFACYQLIAARQLQKEASHVQDELCRNGLEAGRVAVSMIVGRDTQELDEAGVLRAAIETVAENTSDGVVAPLLFMAMGGAPAAMLYKATNTMDSMVGYKNDRYKDFGWAAAKLDDILNWIPARVTGALMCVAAPAVGLSGTNAWRILQRDKRRHASPNAAYPEAACAGALGIRLAGPASYFGVLHHKPTIGDDDRDVEPADVKRATRLLYATSVLALALSVAVSATLGTLRKRR